MTLHGDKGKEEEVIEESTVQEKNITFPTDTKLLTKIVTRCRIMAKLEGVKRRRSFQCEIKKRLRIIRFKSKDEAQRAIRRLRSFAGVLIRAMKRKLSPDTLEAHQPSLDLYDRVQRQQRTDAGKIYSLHEPDTFCINKGKPRKKYEFSAKASATGTKISGIIVDTPSFSDNPFDGHTLPAVLSQAQSIAGQRPTMAICDRGYRDKLRNGDTRIEIPESDSGPKTEHKKCKAREPFPRRAAIEPIICYLKNDHRMLQNYLKGRIGDAVNLVHGLCGRQLPKVHPDPVFFAPPIT